MVENDGFLRECFFSHSLSRNFCMFPIRRNIPLRSALVRRTCRSPHRFPYRSSRNRRSALNPVLCHKRTPYNGASLDRIRHNILFLSGTYGTNENLDRIQYIRSLLAYRFDGILYPIYGKCLLLLVVNWIFSILSTLFYPRREYVERLVFRAVVNHV